MDEKELMELKKDTIILAHNYQTPDIQAIADFVGDSLQLCQEAARVDKPYILFCGVDFMAESAVMLNPGKTVLMPDLGSKCPMAAMLPAEAVRAEKEKHPDAAVVLYINTWVEARAESDVTCTSANAVKIVGALPEKKILFGPDANLAWHVQKNLPEKEILPIPYKGHCRVHVRFKKDDLLSLIAEHPDAEVLIHPECRPEVQEIADFILSTGGMERHVRQSNAHKFIIGTETGLIYKLKQQNPGKEFIPALSSAVCSNMKKHTIDKVIAELREKKNIVTVDPKLAEKARKSLERMLELS
ncbi:quinolinate synthase A [archaeon BMS3Abin16]|nr:quinolinate synthase A [archaeon BMS3Abin16]HDY74637.1 quinolinate synthase NadA [Euryarchaeota archaeon]